jgi:hypothetical protein
LEDVANASMALVEAPCVEAVELAHGSRKVGERGLNREVIVVVHQAVGVEDERVAVDHVGESFEEGAPIFVVSDDGLACVAA